jgi:hypothetical protein
LARRAQRVIAQISETAFKLRHELLDDIPVSELRSCIRVLNRIRQKAEKGNGGAKQNGARPPSPKRYGAAGKARVGKNGQN